MKETTRNVITRVLFALSCLAPRDRERFVFIGWHIGKDMEIFADNTKYLFLHMHTECPNVRAIWLAKDRKLAALLTERGYESYYHKSLKGIWHALLAGYTVIDAYLQPDAFRWSGRTKVVQLLHGRGMKKKGYADPQIRNQDYIFCTSPFTEKLLPESFKEGAQVFHTGYPRNDVLFREIAGSDISTDARTKERLARSKEAGKRALLYAPTFRRGEKVFGLASKFDFDAIDRWAGNMGAHFYVSLHPKYRDQARGKDYANVFFVEESEVYPLLSSFELLIADYSSLIYDYLLLDRPIVFFPYDLEDYSSGEGLAFPYEEHTPGPKAFDTASLMQLIERELANDSSKEHRARVRDLYHTHQDGNASERIVEALEITKV